MADLIVPKAYRDKHNSGFAHFLKSGTGPVINNRIEITGMHARGHEIPIELSVAAFHDGAGYVANAFLRDITDKAKGFFDRDMYVFVLDRNGTYVAFGGNTAKVNTRVQDLPGIDGQGLLDSIYTQADREPGWVEYDITNPATGKVQTKLSYVQQVDDVYVGCGVYKNLVAS